MFDRMRLGWMFGLATAALLALAPAARAERKLYVVTTLTDLAAIAEAVGGDKVRVESIGKGTEDPHNVATRPSHVVKLNKADLFVRVGMELELWSQPLSDAARNAKILLGGPGYVDVSVGAEILEIPTTKYDRSMGDLHPYGNPHFWLDPLNGKVIAVNIAAGLKRIAPADADYFDQNLKRFCAQVDEKLPGWLKLMAPYKDVKVVTYHRSWPNFAHRFGLNIVNYVEPKPGVPPSPTHIVSLIAHMKAEDVKVIIQEPYFDLKVGKFVAEKTGAKLLVLSPSVGGEEGIRTYFDLFDRDLEKLVSAFKETGVRAASPTAEKTTGVR